MPAGKLTKVYSGKKINISALAKKVNKMSIQNKPEVKRKITKIFDLQNPSASFALTQSLATSRLLSNLVTGGNDSNIEGSKIFLKGIQLRFYINSPTALDGTGESAFGRLMMFSASSGALATRATPTSADVFVNPEGDITDLNAIVDKSKVRMHFDKRVALSTVKQRQIFMNKYIKINQHFQFAESNADVSGSVLGKNKDYYLAFVGGGINSSAVADVTLLQVSCEAVIYYTDV